MNSTTANPGDQRRSLLGRLIRRVFSRWMLKRCLFGLVALATLAALVLAVENWRGRRVLDNYVREWEAKGERFDRGAFLPPAVPDEENFALTPLLAGMFERQPSAGTNLARITGAPAESSLSTHRTDYQPGGPRDAGGNFFRGTRINLTAWQEYYRHRVDPTNSAKASRSGVTATNLFPVSPEPQTPARDVLLALSRYDREFAELHTAAAQRPHTRFPISYSGQDIDSFLLPHLARMKSLALALRLRATAFLADGQTDRALADVLLWSRLDRGQAQEPFLISFLVRVACHSILLQPVYEGLADHRWTEGQLLVLQKQFEATDFIGAYRQVMRGERAMFQIAGLVDRRQPKPAPNPGPAAADSASDSFGTMQRMFARLPRGFVYQNQVNLYRVYQATIDSQPGEIRNRLQEVLGQMSRRHPYQMFAAMLGPAFDKTMAKATRAQTYVHLSTVACALERYRLRHGRFPGGLEALVPEFLKAVPADYMTGESLCYRRSEDDRFTLWAVGDDRKDDHGAFEAPPKAGKKPSGDWVWAYPLPETD
jgi:hypothetical protein